MLFLWDINVIFLGYKCYFFGISQPVKLLFFVVIKIEIEKLVEIKLNH